jgi:multiple sugar transport system permease protein
LIGRAGSSLAADCGHGDVCLGAVRGRPVRWFCCWDTFAAPFTLPLNNVPFWQLAGLLAFVASVTAANHVSLNGATARGDVPLRTRGRLYPDLQGHRFRGLHDHRRLPFYVMVMTSLKSQQALLANPLDLSIDVSQGFDGLFRSYVELFTQFNFGRYLMVSAIVSVATVILTLLFSVPGAYAVSRLRFPGQALLSRSVLLIYMVPAIVLVIPLYAVFSQLGLRNTLTGLLIVYPATTIPVCALHAAGLFPRAAGGAGGSRG